MPGADKVKYLVTNEMMKGVLAQLCDHVCVGILIIYGGGLCRLCKPFVLTCMSKNIRESICQDSVSEFFSLLRLTLGSLPSPFLEVFADGPYCPRGEVELT